STTVLIERTPTASSRRLSHSGDGPTVAPRITAEWNRGQDSASSMAMRTPPTLSAAPACRADGTSMPAAPGICGRRNGLSYAPEADVMLLRRAGVGRAADDVAARAGAVVAGGDPEAVGIRVGAHVRHQADHGLGEIGVKRLDGVHRRAEHGEAVGHVRRIQRAAEEVLEPAEGDVHWVLGMLDAAAPESA